MLSKWSIVGLIHVFHLSVICTSSKLVGIATSIDPCDDKFIFAQHIFSFHVPNLPGSHITEGVRVMESRG